MSEIVFVTMNELRRSDAPPGYGPRTTFYNRFVRWSRPFMFNRVFAGLAAEGGAPGQLMVDATHLIARRTAASELIRVSTPMCPPPHR